MLRVLETVHHWYCETYVRGCVVNGASAMAAT